MADHKVEDVKLGAADHSGYDITCIYALNPPDYAIYGTKIRTCVQFADDPVLARQQRSAMSACSPLRGQINGLIDGWRGGGRRSRGHRVADYDRRVADALVMGFEGSVANTLALLTEIRNDIVAERRSLAQSDYLVTAVLAVATLLLLFVCIRLGVNNTAYAHASWNAALTGASGGTLGAFFSIAVGMRSRTVLVDIQKWDNRRDAILRVIVGTIGGGILICLFLTKLVTALNIDSTTLAAGDGLGGLTSLVIGFLAGFSERAVPDMLERASLATDASTGTNATDVATDQARAAASADAQQDAAGARQGLAAAGGAPAGDAAPAEGEAMDAEAEGEATGEEESPEDDPTTAEGDEQSSGDATTEAAPRP